MRACVRACVCMCMCAYVWLCLCACVCVCVWVCGCVCVCLRVPVHTCMCVAVCVRACLDVCAARSTFHVRFPHFVVCRANAALNRSGAFVCAAGHRGRRFCLKSRAGSTAPCLLCAAAWATVPRGISRRARYRASWNTVPHPTSQQRRPTPPSTLQRLKAESSRRWARAAAEASALARALVSGGGSEGDCAYERRLRGPQVRPCGW